MVREGETQELGSDVKDFICSSFRWYINFYTAVLGTYLQSTYSIILPICFNITYLNVYIGICWAYGYV